MQFKLLVVKVLLNFMVSFQGKLHAMYYLIDCFLLLNIHLFPPPVFSLISRDDNDFSGRKGERLTGLTRDLPEEQACRREVAAKTDSFSGTPLCNIFTVGVWDSTRTPFLLNAGSQASETWRFFKMQSPPISSKKQLGRLPHCSLMLREEQEQLVYSSWACESLNWHAHWRQTSSSHLRDLTPNANT